MKTIIGRVVEYTDIFPEEKDHLPDVTQLISHISRKHMVTLVSNMMIRLSGRLFFDADLIPTDDNVDFIRFFLSRRNPAFIENVIHRYHQLKTRCAKEGYQGPLLATRPAAILRLQRYMFAIPPCKDDYSRAMEIDFFKALLLINQEVNNSIVHEEVDKKYPLDLQMANIVIGYSYSNEGCENGDYNDVLRRQLTRFSEFYSFIHRQKKLKPIRERFRAFYGLKDIAYYLAPHTGTAYITKGKSGMIEMTGVNKLTKVNRRIMRLDSLSYDAIVDFKSNSDYSVFRSKPFIKLDKNSFAVTSMQFVLEHIYESIYFQIKPYSTLAGFADENQFRQYFTTDFAQDWMLNRFIRRCLGTDVECALTDQDCKKIISEKNYKGVQPPDYYIREGNNVFLFELKVTLASARTKEARDSIAFFKDLHMKFFENKKKEPKAIRQLSSSIKAIQDGTFAFDDHVSRKSNIYPVLVVDSTYYTMRGLHTKLEYWMREYFNTIGIDGNFVKPLILVDISTLRLYCTEFRTNGFAFIFEGYYKDIEWQSNPT